MANLTKPQERFLWNGMKARRPVSDYGSDAVVCRNLLRLGYVESAGCSPVGHFEVFRLTSDGLAALLDWHQRRYAKSGCIAYMDSLKTVEAAIADAKVSA